MKLKLIVSWLINLYYCYHISSEAAQLDIDRLKTFREEVRSRAPAIEELQTFYENVTAHNPDSVDPVIRAIKV